MGILNLYSLIIHAYHALIIVKHALHKITVQHVLMNFLVIMVHANYAQIDARHVN